MKKAKAQQIIDHLLLSDDPHQIAFGKLLATGILDRWYAWNSSANWQDRRHAAENMEAVMRFAATIVSVAASANYNDKAYPGIVAHLSRMTRLMLKHLEDNQ